MHKNKNKIKKLQKYLKMLSKETLQFDSVHGKYMYQKLLLFWLLAINCNQIIYDQIGCLG